MIKNARVSLASLKTFEKASSGILDFSDKFDRGNVCIDQIIDLLTELIRLIVEKIAQMVGARDALSAKIKEIEVTIARLDSQIEEIQSRIDEIESEMDSMGSTMEYTDSEGNTHSVPNPEYVALEMELSGLESERSMLEAERRQHQNRLDKANSVDGRLASHLDSSKAIQYSLEEKRESCKVLSQEYKDLKDLNLKKSTYATERIKDIEKVVERYGKIKMSYDNSDHSLNGASVSENGINITINIKPQYNYGEDGKKTIDPHEAEVQASRINSNERLKESDVIKVDKKSFGGTYNTYKDIIESTPKGNNPVIGMYTGLRGESKFIPSDRTVEGIKVIEILCQYKVDGIDYRNGEPDFEPCCEAVVKISGMTEKRYDYTDSHSGETVYGNFSRADIELAKVWNFDERDGRTDWTPRDVSNYRKKNGLTWHEKCDTKTMVLVRTEINAFFRHSGGCSECRIRDSKGGLGGEFDE